MSAPILRLPCLLDCKSYKDSPLLVFKILERYAAEDDRGPLHSRKGKHVSRGSTCCVRGACASFLLVGRLTEIYFTFDLWLVCAGLSLLPPAAFWAS